MNTFLGASQYLPAAALDEEPIASGAILYLEGYLWDPEEPRRAMRRAIEVARDAGRKVAFTAFRELRDRPPWRRFPRQLIDDGMIDILFVNESELATLTGEDDFEAGIDALEGKVPVLVVTRSEKGAVAIARRRARRGRRRAGRRGGRHDRRGRPVRRRVPRLAMPRASR